MTSFVIKLIALICMLIDHLGAVFPLYFPSYCRVIGRIAFPLFVYLIADGCRYTRSMPKYLFRLGIFALISQIPFDLAFNQTAFPGIHISFLQDVNVFYTLFLGALSVYAYQQLKTFNQKGLLLLSVLPLLGAMYLAQIVDSDYGGFGVAFVFLMYCVPPKIPRLCVMALCCAYEYNTVVWGLLETVLGLRLFDRSYALYVNPFSLWLLAGCLLAVPIAALHNGKRGPGMKWFFYAAYPLHLLIYAGISIGLLYR